ncbi:unnamed protein product [Prorocentrum cordatum]|uniref:CBM20 domain-containing protein n=1 Tax=Prorocentrum cordatum TaxID=2364126 RepID=A0ABN9RN41_9DINO|nr:unnamed protein product [Polarella glacialis]
MGVNQGEGKHATKSVIVLHWQNWITGKTAAEEQESVNRCERRPAMPPDDKMGVAALLLAFQIKRPAARGATTREFSSEGGNDQTRASVEMDTEGLRRSKLLGDFEGMAEKKEATGSKDKPYVRMLPMFCARHVRNIKVGNGYLESITVNSGVRRFRSLAAQARLEHEQAAMSAGGGKPCLTRVVFRCRFDDVQVDQEVRVVGDSDQLGNWTPEKGVVLEESLDVSGCYSSRAVLMPLGKTASYKYLVVKKGSGEVAFWEEREVRGAGFGAAFCAVGQFNEELHGVAEEVDVSEEDTVFVVFRKLPFRVERVTGTSALSAAHAGFRVVTTDSFVGDPGIHTEDKEEQAAISKLLAPYGCIPVFVPKKTNDQFLEFCNMLLWPVMHNTKVNKDDLAESEVEEAESRRLDEARWKSYKAVNTAYAEVLQAQSSPADLIWVHNYYLLLVPRYLILRQPAALVGFFLHCAFPSSEVLRCLPMREEIVQSMLSCKVVTFQIFEYARHFISCCALLLRTTTHSFQSGGVLQIEHEGRTIVIRADHFVLPFSRFTDRLEKVIRR